MELESYFDFSPDGIRLKKTRVYLEDIIKRYFEGDSPEEINTHFPTVTVEQAYASVLYYLVNRSKVDEYTKEMKKEARARHQEYLKHPSDFHISLKKRIEALRKQGNEILR
jgi:uncharacterized protein (DUF433 family)